MTNDTVSDMLTRIRNANNSKHHLVQVPATKMTRNMMEQLDPFTNPDVAFVPLKEGGLASINNPQYNMLMKASDFDI